MKKVKERRFINKMKIQWKCLVVYMNWRQTNSKNTFISGGPHTEDGMIKAC